LQIAESLVEPMEGSPRPTVDRAPLLQPAPRAPLVPATPPPPAAARVAEPASRPTPRPAPAPPVQSSAERVKEQFRRRFWRQMGLTAIMLPAAVAARLDRQAGHSPLELAGLAVVFVAFVLTLVNWRCPECGRYLYRRIYPRTCPRCGVTFHD
jgi:hypothetical protein